MFRAILCFLLWPISIVATTLRPHSLEMPLHQGFISHIRIIEAKAHEFEYNSQRYVCAISVKAEVIETVWASSDFIEIELIEIDFQSHSQLAINQEYVVFFGKLDRELPPGMKVISRPDYFQSEEYQTCKDDLPELVGNAAYEFFRLYMDERGSLEWLKQKYLSPRVPQHIKTTKVKCYSGDSDESACERISEPVLIHWPSLRRFIQGWNAK